MQCMREGIQMVFSVVHTQENPPKEREEEAGGGNLFEVDRYSQPARALLL